MTRFVGTTNDVANAETGELLGFTGGTIADLLDDMADRFVCGTGSDFVKLNDVGGHAVLGGTGNDELYGGTGTDELHGNNGNDIISGGGAADVLYGGAKNDAISGGNGNDVIEGGGGIDQLNGGSGADTFILRNGEKPDHILGGGEWDEEVNTLDLSNITLGRAVVDLTIGVWYLQRVGDEGTIDQVHRIIGTQRNDSLRGSVVDDVLVGGRGPDSLYGLDGSDRLAGEDANDRLYGGGGEDFLEGLRGADWLYGEDGGDILQGGTGKDALEGGSGEDFLDGGAETDMLTGGDGIDYFLMNEVPDGVNVDTIVDFEQGIDKIGIRSANSALIFAAIGETLDAGEVANGAAQDADDFILYDAVTGLVSYDADGNGAGGAFAFVRLATLPASLSVSDFGVDVFPNI